MTEQYTETRIISLNSEYANNKINGDYLSHVEFYFKDILRDSEDIDHTSIQIINALSPVSYYTINENNDILKLNSFNITITRGNYNSSNLITELKARILAVTGLSFNIIISRITGILTFYNSTNFTFYPNALAKVLGFNELVSGWTSTFSSNPLGDYQLTAPFSLNLLGIKKIKVLSNALPTFSYDSFGTGSTNIVNTIPVTAPPFGLIIYNQLTNPLVLRVNTINKIDIQLVDENNLFIDFNKINWSMTLQLDIVRIRNSLAKIPTNITDLLGQQIEQELEKIDTDIQTLANSQQEIQPEQEQQEQLPDLASDLDILQS